MKNSNIKELKKRLETHHKSVVKNVQKNHQKALQVAKVNALALVGSALFAGSSIGVAVDKKEPHTKVLAKGNEGLKSNTNELFEKMQSILLANPKELTEEEETLVEQALTNKLNTSLKVTLQGNRLNKVWGYFGQEQHLYRWPGDSLSSHNEYLEHGIAPGKGAFGDFDNAEQEKYYIAAPLHLLPNWNTNWSTLKPWYRYRKVVVYNPKNQKAVVATIGDAGPAAWTGKEFGGSPEVMHYLNMVDGAQKSQAIVLFVEDNNLPLGPINLN